MAARTGSGGPMEEGCRSSFSGGMTPWSLWSWPDLRNSGGMRVVRHKRRGMGEKPPVAVGQLQAVQDSED